MKKLLFATFLTVMFYGTINSQSYVGYNPDNYSGIQGLFYNPSSVVSSKLRGDINLFSVSTLAGSDYFNLDINELIKVGADFNFESGFTQTPTNQNNVLFNLDVTGPSFMFNISPKHSIALTTRGRGLLNVNNVNGELFEAFEEDFENSDDFQANMNDLNATFQAWTELGLTYGRVLFQNTSHSLIGGLSLKYLRGAGGFFLNSPASTFNYTLGEDMLTSTGTMNYGQTQGFEDDDINLSNPGIGFGADVGFTYEYRPQVKNFDFPSSDDYKFKFGLSVVDFGRISYDNVQLNSYDLNRTVDVNDLDGENLEEVLMNNYEGSEDLVSSKFSLPTAMHVLLDYQVRKRLYIAVQGSFSLISNTRPQYHRILNSVTAIPRLETKWLGIGIPIGIRQYDNLVIGTTLRLGPLHIGSGSILSNMLFDSSTTDIYAGINIPLYKKS